MFKEEKDISGKSPQHQDAQRETITSKSKVSPITKEAKKIFLEWLKDNRGWEITPYLIKKAEDEL